MDRGQYLILMAACVVITLPLEFVFGARVYRQPKRLLAAVLPVALLFAVWDVAAIARDHWRFSSRYTTGWELLGALPIEEIAFFLVIPVCGLLTYGAVERLWPERRR